MGVCSNPYTSEQGQAYGCGKCLACRINKRRVWAHRIMLEAMQHADNTFLTLTYDDDHLPPGAHLRPEDVTLFIKKFRNRILPGKVRYFLVGEYGDQTWRPHYHLALFGYPNCQWGQTRKFKRPDRVCCNNCQLVREAWGNGSILLGDLSPESAQYIAGYTLKKMTHMDDFRLDGRPPEYARMSLRPGLGQGMMHEVASTLLALNLEATEADVPVSLRHGKKEYPLGYYLRQQLRQIIGRSKKAPQASIDAQAEKMLPLRLASRQDPEGRSVKTLLIEQNQGKLARLAAREKLKRKKSL